MGRAIRASALALLLACSASAGTMQNDATAPPPPPPSQQRSDGIMGHDSPQSRTGQEPTAGDVSETSLLVQIALNLLTLL